MRRIAQTTIAVATLALLSPLAAPAASAQSLITTPNTDQIASVLTAMGKTIKVDNSGTDPDITITRPDGSRFYDIYLMDCTDKRDCNSIELLLTYENDGSHSPELANEWNANNRMPGMYFDKSDKTMSLYFNVSTTGGLTQENFADVIKWWESSLGTADTFFSQHPAPK
jgi:hypothetical protein